MRPGSFALLLFAIACTPPQIIDCTMDEDPACEGFDADRRDGAIERRDAGDADTPEPDGGQDCAGTCIVEIATAQLFACARTMEGAVYCWGDGPVGNGTPAPSCGGEP